jgi:hypothetical protein
MSHVRWILSAAIWFSLGGRADPPPPPGTDIGISILREVVVDAFPPSAPTAITNATHGTYVITGSSNRTAWALKVDKTGTVLWRHEYQGAPDSDLSGNTAYEDAAVRADGSVLLCGYAATPGGRLDGLLTLLGGGGAVRNEKLLEAAPDGSKATNFLNRCAATTAGFVAVGTSGAEDWIVGVRTDGSIQWQKSPRPASRRDDGPFPAFFSATMKNLVVLKNGDFITIDAAFDAIRFSSDGEVRARGNAEVPVFPVRGRPESLAAISMVRTPIVTTFNERIEPVERVKAGWSQVDRRLAAFSLQDGRLAVFGSYDHDTPISTAAIGWISADRRMSAALIIQPTYGSNWVVAASPTDVPNQFAFVRHVIAGMEHRSSAPNETRSGVLLSFVEFH